MLLYLVAFSRSHRVLSFPDFRLPLFSALFIVSVRSSRRAVLQESLDGLLARRRASSRSAFLLHLAKRALGLHTLHLAMSQATAGPSEAMPPSVPRPQGLTQPSRTLKRDLLTEHFRFAPETFAKGGMDLANRTMYTATAKVEQSLQQLVEQRVEGFNEDEVQRVSRGRPQRFPTSIRNCH